MYNYISLSFLILSELVCIIVGIKTHPFVIFFIPLGFVILWMLINHVGFTLMLLSFTAVIKGVLIQYFPIFSILDTTIVITLILWLGLIKLLFEGNWRFVIEHKQPLFLFILLIFVTAFSLFYTPSPTYGTSKVIRFAFIGFSMFLTPLIIIKSTSDSEKILNYFKYSIFIILIGIISQFIYFAISGKFAFLLGYYNRFSIPGANPIQVSRYLAIGATIMIVFLIKRSIHNNKSVMFMLLMLLLGIIATGSRGPLVSIFLGVLIYAFIFEKQQKNRIYIYSLFAIFISISMLFILPEIITKRFFDITKGAVLMTPEGVKQVNTVATRLGYWQMSIVSWSSSLWNIIMGKGAGGFSSLFIWRDWRWYPHNVFFEILVEYGLTGFIVFSGFLIASFNKIRIGIINGKFSEHSAVWVAVTIVMFISAQFSGDINDNRVLWMCISISIASTHVDYVKHLKTVQKNIVLN